MSQELLDRADVVSPLHQVSRKAVTQSVDRRVLDDSRAGDSKFEGFLEAGWVDVVPANHSGSRID